MRFYYRELNSSTFPSQIINPFLNSIISAYHEKEEKFQPIMVKSLYLPLTVSLVKNLFFNSSLVRYDSFDY